MSNLQIELVPKTCWYSNVRSNVSTTEWDALRRECYKRANMRCEICGSSGQKQGFRHPVECHEIWHYDDENYIQTLKGLISLCPMCHKAKHCGFAQVSGNEDIVRKHIKEVNNWTEGKLDDHINDVFSQWSVRSQHDWELDITLLGTYFHRNDPLDALIDDLKNL